MSALYLAATLEVTDFESLDLNAAGQTCIWEGARGAASRALSLFESGSHEAKVVQQSRGVHPSHPNPELEALIYPEPTSDSPGVYVSVTPAAADRAAANLGSFVLWATTYVATSLGVDPRVVEIRPHAFRPRLCVLVDSNEWCVLHDVRRDQGSLITALASSPQGEPADSVRVHCWM